MKYTGLSLEEVEKRQLIYGKNEIDVKKKRGIRKILGHVLQEPIYILLFVSAIIYYLLGSPVDGAVMIGFVVIVVSIDVLQDMRTSHTLKKLKSMTDPKVSVIRENDIHKVAVCDIVPGDLVVLEAGVKVPADGYLLEALGLKLDESIITGEMQGVWKEVVGEETVNHNCYLGTMVLLGKGIMGVEKTGLDTQYGQVAAAISLENNTNSILEQQMSKVAYQCTLVAVFLFIIVGIATYYNLPQLSGMERIVQSMLAGTVLALSMVPGEFPVIKSVFLTMGALRMAKESALVRRLSAIEQLGGITTLCIDKTGTITENQMTVKEIWMYRMGRYQYCRGIRRIGLKESKDPLDQSILVYCNQLCEECKVNSMELPCDKDRTEGILIREYPFDQQSKATGLVWFIENQYYISIKGSPESILRLCNLPQEEIMKIEHKMNEFSSEGLRIIGFGEMTVEREEDIPTTLAECDLLFSGLIGLEDPPRRAMCQHVKDCYESGIRICMITGDHPNTAKAIGNQIGMELGSKIITGDEIETMDLKELIDHVKDCNVYARVLPIHKMKIIEALQASGEKIAMAGDGINDSAALSMADVGIAMGQEGADICKETADVILLDNNIATIISTIWDGRRIYQNIMKAVGYILAIHTPIALISLISPMIGIPSEELMLLPMHIILLELVMNPVCSIVLERQPLECRTSFGKEKQLGEKMLTKELIAKSLIQGIIIFIGSFFLYNILRVEYNSMVGRTAGFVVLILANILLVLENSSEHNLIHKTFMQIRKDPLVMGVNAIIIFSVLLIIYSPMNRWFGFTPLSLPVFAIVIGTSILSVCWFEVVKIAKKVILRKRDD